MLVEKTNKVMAGIDEMMAIVKRKTDLDSLKNMDADEFELVKVALKMVDDCRDLALEQAKVMDDMNKKLDRLLAAK